MDFTKFANVVRHALTGIGAGLVGFGYATSDGVASVLSSFDGIIGGLAVVAGFGLSIINQIKGNAAK